MLQAILINQRLRQYLLESGIKQGHIAKELGIPDAVLSGFKNNKKNLWYESLVALDTYLKSKDY